MTIATTQRFGMLEDLSYLLTPIDVLEEYVELLKKLTGYSVNDECSVASKLATLSELEQEEIYKLIPDQVAHDLKYCVLFTGRRKQQPPPPDQRTNLILAGRGFGKNWAASHIVHYWAFKYPGTHIALVGQTHKDVDRTVIHGPIAGIVATANPNFKPEVHLSKLSLYYPNGSRVSSYTGEKGGEDLRGPSHQFAVVDEFAKFPADKQEDVLANLRATMRGYPNPTQMVFITTPKNTKMMRRLVADSEAFNAKGKKKVYLTTGTSYENTTLEDEFFEDIKSSTSSTYYEQEMLGKLLMQDDSALFTFDMIDESRVETNEISLTHMNKVVLSVDPTIGDAQKKSQDECGIILGGSKDGHGYCFYDYSEKLSPAQWIKKCIRLYHMHNCDYLLIETNAGAAHNRESILKEDPTIKIREVHAHTNKHDRALPVSGAMENGYVHIVGREMEELEEQMTSFDINNKKAAIDDRLDAFIHLMVDLVVKKKKKSSFF